MHFGIEIECEGVCENRRGRERKAFRKPSCNARMECILSSGAHVTKNPLSSTGHKTKFNLVNIAYL